MTAEDDVRPRVDEAVAQGDVDITRLGVELDSPVDDYDDEVGILLGGLHRPHHRVVIVSARGPGMPGSGDGLRIGVDHLVEAHHGDRPPLHVEHGRHARLRRVLPRADRGDAVLEQVLPRVEEGRRAVVVRVVVPEVRHVDPGRLHGRQCLRIASEAELLAGVPGSEVRHRAFAVHERKVVPFEQTAEARPRVLVAVGAKGGDVSGVEVGIPPRRGSAGHASLWLGWEWATAGR